MNKHTKLAIFIAPVLLILGYIGSDYYMEYKAGQTKLYPLQSDGRCDLLAQKCVLTSGELKINVYDESGTTKVNSTFPLDSATLFLVDDDGQSTAYPLSKEDNAYYWQSPTPLRANRQSSGDRKKMRLIVQIKGGQYFAEFFSASN